MWLDEFQEYANSGHLADILLRYMFVNNHGLIFKPSFVPTLNGEQARYLTGPLADKMYHGLDPQISRICDPPYFEYAWQLSESTS